MISLLDLIQQDVPLRRRGHEYVGLCPFHAEQTPSFSVNEEKGVYLCRGCGAAGDAITYVQRREGLSFREAARRVGKDLSATERKRTARTRAAVASVLHQFYTWQHDHARTLTQLHDAIWLAELAYRALCRAPHVWSENDHQYWIHYLSDLYFALEIARQDNEALTDPRTSWGLWQQEVQRGRAQRQTASGNNHRVSRGLR